MPTKSYPYLNWILMFSLAFIWGSSFILMKRGVEVYESSDVALLRLGIAWISLLPFSFSKLRHVEKSKWFPILIVAFFGNGIPAFLFTKAQTELDSSLIGILNALVPLFTILIAFFIFKTKIKYYNFIGVLIGLFGAVWLIIGSGIVIQNVSYTLLIILATICYAISLNTIKVYLSNLSSIQIAALAFLFIGPLSLVLISQTTFWHTFNTHPDALSALGYIVILSVIGTSLALVLFNILIKRSTAIFASSVTYLIPIVAIFWGAIDGEAITLNHALGILIIFGGIYLVNKD